MQQPIPLNELSCFLSYGLKLQVQKKLDKPFVDEIYIGQLVELTHQSNHGDWAKVRFDDCYTVTYQGYQDRFSNFHDYFLCEDVIKPIVLPLSTETLTAITTVTVDGKKWQATPIDYISTSIKDAQRNMRLLIDGKADQLEQWKFNRLCEMHFDVFNWLEKWQGVNINDLKG